VNDQSDHIIHSLFNLIIYIKTSTYVCNHCKITPKSLRTVADVITNLNPCPIQPSHFFRWGPLPTAGVKIVKVTASYRPHGPRPIRSSIKHFKAENNHSITRPSVNPFGNSDDTRAEQGNDLHQKSCSSFSCVTARHDREIRVHCSRFCTSPL
jgi:hypothetical protein